MYITLKMTIDNQEINLDVNLANRAGRIYRQQYNRDILKDMGELYRKVNRSPFDDIDTSQIDIINMSREEIAEHLVANADIARLIQNDDRLDFSDTERAGQIIWAFAKNRDKDLPNYEEWIDNFDFVLPVEQIITALYDAWGKSAQPTIELKN